MPEYRRHRAPGATYFFTVNLLDRHSDLLVARIDALRAAVRAVHKRSPFQIDAWVVMPDHMHALWTLPEGDADYPSRWRDIKTAFTKSLPATEQRSATMTSLPRRENGGECSESMRHGNVGRKTPAKAGGIPPFRGRQNRRNAPPRLAPGRLFRPTQQG